MRLCASLFRGVAAPLGCVIFFHFCRNCGLYILHSGYFRVCEVVAVSLPPVRFACCRNAGRPLAKTAHLPFSEVGWLSLISAVQNVSRFFWNVSSPQQTAPVPCERNRSCFFRHFMERARKAAICALVQVAVGSKRPPPTPAVMPLVPSRFMRKIVCRFRLNEVSRQ